MKFGLAIVLSALVAAQVTGVPAAAQANEAGVSAKAEQLARARAIVEANTLPLDFRDGRLSGPGWTRLVEQAGAAQFVLIGEPHNTRELNEFVALLFSELHENHGYNHLVLEQDPYLVEAIESAAESGGVAAVGEYARTHPLGFHFFGDAELGLYALAARADIGAIANLWGVDRSLDLVPALRRARQLSSDPGLTAKIDAVIAASLEYDAETRNAFDPETREKSRYMVSDTAEIDALAAMLASASDARLRAIGEHLRLSREDLLEYQRKHPAEEPWGYRANLRREELMKSNFARHLQKARAAGEERPKAIVKMGGWHTTRGFNSGLVGSLGNAIEGLARLDGGGSISIDVTVANQPGQHWSITDYEDYAYVFPAVSPDHWTLVDLRPLRGHFLSGWIDLPKEARDQIFGFDYLLIMSGTQAEATDIISPPKSGN